MRLKHFGEQFDIKVVMNNHMLMILSKGAVGVEPHVGLPDDGWYAIASLPGLPALEQNP